LQHFKITIQYDGSNYHGWQIQAGHRTIQGELTRVLTLLDHQQVIVHGAGRTDAGVHAEGQAASFALNCGFDPLELRNAINGNLEPDIRVVDCVLVPDSFHARLSAKSKYYRYRIWTAPVVSPFEYRYVCHCTAALRVSSMERAAAGLIGTHDFSAFTIKDAEVKSKTRTITRLDCEQVGPEIRISAEADGFLRFMVRTIAGTLIDVGQGKIDADAVKSILDSKDRNSAGRTAPARGLTLMRIDY
jgi:tRNA pseudouridine38-40 synthase